MVFRLRAEFLEVIEFQKQHIAHLLGQVSALTSQCCSLQATIAKGSLHIDENPQECARATPWRHASVKLSRAMVCSHSLKPGVLETIEEEPIATGATVEHTAEELADPLFAVPKFQENISGAISRLANIIAPPVLDKCLPASIAQLLQKFEAQIDQKLEDRIATIAAAAAQTPVNWATTAVAPPPDVANTLSVGSFAQLQCLTATELNGKIGYITEELGQNRYGAYIPAEDKSVSIAGSKLRLLTYGELAELQGNRTKWRPEYYDRIDKARREAQLKADRKVVGNVSASPSIAHENREFLKMCEANSAAHRQEDSKEAYKDDSSDSGEDHGLNVGYDDFFKSFLGSSLDSE